MAKSFFGITDMGRMRNNNEDTFVAVQMHDGDRVLLAAIDGVGGYEGGEVAAAIASDTIQKALLKPGGDLQEEIKAAIRAANQHIRQEKKNTGNNPLMACVVTVAIADTAANKCYFGHVGDTRLYLFRDGSLVKITRDHSFVGFLEDNGKLNEFEAMNHPKRNEINKALGFDDELPEDYIETGVSPFLPGDLLLLCSDGLTDMVSNADMVAVLSGNDALEAKGKALVAAANDAGGKDNITVVLAYNNKPSSRPDFAAIAATPASDRAETLDKSNVAATSIRSTMPLKKSSTSGVANLFKVLALLIVLALAWLIWLNYRNGKQHQRQAAAIELKMDRNPQEQLLLDSIQHTTTAEVFMLNQPGSLPVVISDSININNDTLHIIGNGATLAADSNYKGPAFIIAANCKNIVLDSITFTGFDVGVVTNSRGLRFNNVKFLSCRVPVQYQFLPKDSVPVSGSLKDTMFQRFAF